MKKKMLVLCLIGCLMYLAADCFFIVRESEFVIVTQFGRIVSVIGKSGLYRKLPLSVQKVNRIDKRIMVFECAPTTYILGDKNPLVISCYVCYRITRPETVIQRFVTVESLKQQMDDMLVSQLGNELGNYRIENIINVNREEIRLNDIENKVTRDIGVKALEEYGIEIVSIGIKKITYPPVVAKSVYERMKSERQIEASRYRADGQQQSAKIDAETNLKVSEIMSDAIEKSEITKGIGDNKSISMYSSVFSKDPEFFKFINTLESYKDIIRKNDVLIFSMKDSLFKYLTDIGEVKKND